MLSHNLWCLSPNFFRTKKINRQCIFENKKHLSKIKGFSAQAHVKPNHGGRVE
jgi:hypothetical protein